MKILELKAQNVKRLTAVEITPDGNFVIVGGANGAGKSSVLDSIMYCLGGKHWGRVQPLRKGAEEGKVTLRLDGDEEAGLFPMIVERTFTADGRTQLEIRQEDDQNGVYKAASPQKILDDLVGRIAFDPLKFVGLSPKEQAAMLKDLVGLDFTELDQKRERLYQQRTDVNREGKQLKARVDAMPEHKDAPEREVSVSELMTELARREERNRENERDRLELATLERSVEEKQNEIERLKEELTRLETLLTSTEEAASKQREAVSLTADENADEIRQQLSAADEQNRKCRDNKECERLNVELDQMRDKSRFLSDHLDKVDAKKQKQLAEAKWPVDGLGFDDDGVTLNDLPFEQASSREQLLTSAAIGAAMNPILRFMAIRNGSLLDDEGMRVITEFAEKKDFQIWLERVGEDGPRSVVIEDGHVKAAIKQEAEPCQT